MFTLRWLYAVLVSHFASVAAKRYTVDGITGLSKSSLKDRFPFYHTSAELQAETTRLASKCPGAQLAVRTHKKGDVSIDVIHVKGKNSKPINRFFMVCGEHSRELISPESCLYLLQALCGEAETGSVAASQALEDTEFQLVLNQNPGSRLKVEAGEFCLRANPAGVDLNRNWDEKWVPGSGSAGAALFRDLSPGSKPFSEPETQILKQALEDFQPTSFLCVHSGTRGLYMPWAYSTKAASLVEQDTQNPKAKAMMNVLKQVDASHCECPFGAAGKEVGYSCPGTSLDWVYDQLNSSYSFAYEIFGDASEDVELKQRWQEKSGSGGTALLEQGHHLAHPHFKDLFQAHASDFVQLEQQDASKAARRSADACFNQFNPRTKEQYDLVVRNWATAYLQTANLVAQDLRKQAAKKTA